MSSTILLVTAVMLLVMIVCDNSAVITGQPVSDSDVASTTTPAASGDHRRHYKRNRKHYRSRNKVQTESDQSQQAEFDAQLTPGYNPDMLVTIDVLHVERGLHGHEDVVTTPTTARTDPEPYDLTRNHDIQVEVTEDGASSAGVVEWSRWSPCSVTCGGGGVRSRGRMCDEEMCVESQERRCEDQPPCHRGALPALSGGGHGDGDILSLESVIHNTLQYLDLPTCDSWLQCNDTLLKSQRARFGALPSCPCHYPTNIHYNDTIEDALTGGKHRWRDASGPMEHLPVFKGGRARYCIRSLIPVRGSGSGGGGGGGGGGTVSCQQCCYDDKLRLITRGSGAGTPSMVSADVSLTAHYRTDVLPWIMCKGDWTRYHQRRPPNNAASCPVNPEDHDYLHQLYEATNY